jgi:hypothetical protein
VATGSDAPWHHPRPITRRRLGGNGNSPTSPSPTPAGPRAAPGPDIERLPRQLDADHSDPRGYKPRIQGVGINRRSRGVSQIIEPRIPKGVGPFVAFCSNPGFNRRSLRFSQITEPRTQRVRYLDSIRVIRGKPGLEPEDSMLETLVAFVQSASELTADRAVSRITEPRMPKGLISGSYLRDLRLKRLEIRGSNQTTATRSVRRGSRPLRQAPLPTLSACGQV